MPARSSGTARMAISVAGEKVSNLAPTHSIEAISRRSAADRSRSSKIEMRITPLPKLAWNG